MTSSAAIKATELSNQMFWSIVIALLYGVVRSSAAFVMIPFMSISVHRKQRRKAPAEQSILTLGNVSFSCKMG